MFYFAISMGENVSYLLWFSSLPLSLRGSVYETLEVKNPTIANANSLRAALELLRCSIYSLVLAIYTGTPVLVNSVSLSYGSIFEGCGGKTRLCLVN